MSLYTGTIPYTELKPEITYNKREGWRQIRTFTGPYVILNDLGLKIKNQDTNVIQVDVSQQDPSGEARLTATYAIEELQTWTFSSYDFEKDLWWKPNVKAIFDNINKPATGKGGFVMQSIKWGFEYSFRSGKTLTQMLNDSDVLLNEPVRIAVFRTSWNSLSAGQQTIMTQLYDSLGLAATHYPVSGWCLNKVSLVDTFTETYEVWPTYLNLLFTDTDLKTVFDKQGTLPTYISNIMPLTVLSGSIPVENFYLYKSLNVEQQANGRFMVHQQWWYAEDYSKFIYTLYTP